MVIYNVLAKNVEHQHQTWITSNRKLVLSSFVHSCLEFQTRKWTATCKTVNEQDTIEQLILV